MKESTRIFTFLLLLLLYTGIGFVLGYKVGRKPPQTIEKVRVDTTVVFDTIVRERPVYVTSYVERWDTLEVETILHDTVRVELPIERKVYEEDSLYRAVVSGFRPSLDTLIVWPKTTTITIEKTNTIQPSKWGFGAAAGPSVLVTPGGKVYGGIGASVGLTYRF